MHRKRTDVDAKVSFDTQVEGDLLRLTVHGRLDIDFAERMLEEVQRITRHSQVRRLISDMRLATPNSDALHLNRQIARICADESMATMRMALIVNVRSNGVVYTEELAALNSLSFRAFTDGALAEQWLNDPDAGEAIAS